MNALQSLVNIGDRWKADRERIAAIETTESNLLKTLKKHRLKEKTLISELSKNAASEVSCRRRFDDITQAQSDLRKLLSELESHVQSGTCPLCGQSHGSKNKLLSRIRRQVNHDATRRTRIELARIQEAGKRLSDEIDFIKGRLNQKNFTIEQLRQEKVERTGNIKEFENAAVKQGIDIEAPDESLKELLRYYGQARRDICEIHSTSSKRSRRVVRNAGNSRRYSTQNSNI